MVHSQQKHIINKLQVDVATQNPSAAFDLKDHLDAFLKQEIFPYLESYFSTLEEDLQDQIIQIPYVSVDVTTSSTLNYQELKEDVKRALVKNIAELTKKAHPQNEEATLLTTAKSKENQFFYFLEKGTVPWWNHSEDSFEVSDEDFETLIASANFPRLIKNKLMKKVVKQRIIQQLSDQQLKRVWDLLVQEHSSMTIPTKALSIFPSISTQMRQIIWNCLIDFAIQNDIEILVSRLLFALTEDLSEEESKEISTKRRTSSSKQPSLTLISNLLITIPENERVLEAFKMIQKHEFVAQDLASQTSTSSVNAQTIQDREKSENKDSIDAYQLNQTSNNKEFKDEKELLQTHASDDLDTNSLAENTILDKKKNSEIQAESGQEETIQGSDASVNQSATDQTKESKTSSDLETEINEVEHSSKTSKEEKSVSKAQQEVSQENSQQTSARNKETEARIAPSDTEMFEKEDVEEFISQDISRSTNARDSKNESSKESNSRQDQISQKSDDKQGILENKISTKQDQSEVISKEKETIAESEQENTIQNSEEEHLISIEELTSSLQGLVDKQDQKLFKELHKNQLETPIPMEERGEYQINNAGLMMLHPYFEQLFENCDLLNDDKTIKNPDMAIHLLHYVATKKEQQFESNMLFEKILCGVHTSTAIRRNIVLSKEHKDNAEQLLEVVLEHWGVLKNASPDLVRNEFIQRMGIINFKEENGKIKVERKVQDILLEKLPWGIGICRLPWLDYLLFTDW